MGDTLPQCMACLLANPRYSVSMPISFLLAAGCSPWCMTLGRRIPLSRSSLSTVQIQYPWLSGWGFLRDPVLGLYEDTSKVQNVRQIPTPFLRICHSVPCTQAQWVSSEPLVKAELPFLALEARPLSAEGEGPGSLYPSAEPSTPLLLACSSREALLSPLLSLLFVLCTRHGRACEWVQIPCHLRLLGSFQLFTASI